MPQLQLWTIHNIDHNLIYIVKSKKSAERLATLMNKTYKLLNTTTYVKCDPVESFFATHSYSNDTVHFCWKITFDERRRFQRYVYDLGRRIL
jgi:hypothetical protein